MIKFHKPVGEDLRSLTSHSPSPFRVNSRVSGAHLLFSVLLPLAFSLHAFAVQQAWVAKYNNGPGTTNQAVAMALDKDGNIYVAGHSTRTNAPYDYDYVIIKYNPLGVQQWANRFGSSGVDDLIRSMVVSTNGEVFVTGTAGTVKFLTSGLTAWTAPYAGTDVKVDTNGNAHVT